MTAEDRELVADELRENGFQVKGPLDGDRFTFGADLTGREGQFPVFGWVTRLVNGQPRVGARVTFESFGANAVDAPANPGDLSEYTAAAEGRSGWRTLRIVAPPGMPIDDFNLIAKELQAAGNEVRVLKTDTDPQLEVRTPLQHPKPMWETRIVDGKPRKVMRIVDEPGTNATPPGDSQPADSTTGDASSTPSPSLRGRGNSDFGLVRVIQPALATKSNVTAFVEVQPEAFRRTAGADPFGFSGKCRELFQATARSQIVLGAALARPGISDLAIVKAHAGEEVIWLTDELLIHFSDESPVLGFMLKSDGTPSDDLVKLLDAVVASFVDAVESETFQEQLGSSAPRPLSDLRGRGKYHRLGPGDVVLVRSLSALPDHPIDGEFEVEEFGTLALGPAYARVEVEGLTVLEAEAAVTKSLAGVLADPKVQVTLLKRATTGGGPRYGGQAMSSDPPRQGGWRQPSTRSPYRIKPGDELYVDVQGALPDAPIDGKFVVEQEGTLPLGAVYGRADVAGLTVLEAEAAVKELLSKVLSSAEVQVTLLSRAKAAEGDSGLRPSDPPRVR
jgi:protein involved in polysaccharide export with SLBB domain